MSKILKLHLPAPRLQRFTYMLVPILPHGQRIMKRIAEIHPDCLCIKSLAANHTNFDQPKQKIANVEHTGTGLMKE